MCAAVQYIDFGGRGTDRPLSYSSIEKTFYSFFIYQDAVDTPLNYRMDEGENPRELEKEQILRLMNVVSAEIYVGQYDPSIGTAKLESKVQKGDVVPPKHLRAFRMSKEEVLYNWLQNIELIVENYLIMQGRSFTKERLFQYRFPEPLWDRIEAFVANLKRLPLWINRDLSQTAFGKQSYDFWQKVFETGKAPNGQQVLAEPINLMEMMKAPAG